ncbi:MAG: putative rane protein, partial [Myxococcaceae bacterium]|nr:putative rane protein [Myxococcaceae bacterium]
MTLRPAQRTEAALLFAWNYCAVAAFFVGRSVRDALFLAHESPSRLPLMYVASPLAVSLVGLLYARVADRVRRDVLVRATSVALAALALGAWWAVGARWVYYALYVGVEVMGALVMMQFWTSAGDRFSPREARRIFGQIAAGGTVANITVGLLISQLVSRTGAEALLFAVAAFLLAVALIATALARRPGTHRPPPR